MASDIHGSSLWCGGLLEAFGREEPDRLLLLGDILYHGPRNDLPEGYDPKAVIAQLSGIKERILAVRGNCDTEVDQMVLPFPIMADYCIILLAGLAVYATHGHRFNPDSPPPLAKGDVLLYGHTHVPACEERDGILYMNPGSVSIPKENSPRGYMMLEDSAFSWKTLDGAVYRRHDVI